MKYVLDFVGLLGGAGAIIVAIAAFTSKWWADWFMKKKTAEYDKQLEYYKSSLELEREKYKALYDQVIHKNKILFDAEFEIYKDISPKLINAVDTISIWLTSGKLSAECFEVQIKNVADYKDTLSKYALFLDEDMYNLLFEFYNYLTSIGVEILINNSEKYDEYRNNNCNEESYIIWKELCDKADEIKNKKDEVIIKIRDYLRKIATIK